MIGGGGSMANRAAADVSGAGLEDRGADVVAALDDIELWLDTVATGRGAETDIPARGDATGDRAGRSVRGGASKPPPCMAPPPWNAATTAAAVWAPPSSPSPRKSPTRVSTN